MTEEKKPAQSMLERAKKVKSLGRTKLHISDDLVELVLAWARNEVTLAQVASVLEETGIIPRAYAQNAYPKVAEVLQYMVMADLLVPSGWLAQK